MASTDRLGTSFSRRSGVVHPGRPIGEPGKLARGPGLLRRAHSSDGPQPDPVRGGSETNRHVEAGTAVVRAQEIIAQVSTPPGWAREHLALPCGSDERSGTWPVPK